jgi:mono/diheme cytochrome c family protein
MQRNVNNINDDQIAAVVEYISTLTGDEPTDDSP